MIDRRDVAGGFQHRAAGARRSPRCAWMRARVRRARGAVVRAMGDQDRRVHAREAPPHQALQADQLVQRWRAASRRSSGGARGPPAPGCPSRRASSRTARRRRAAGPASRAASEKRSGVPTTTRCVDRLLGREREREQPAQRDADQEHAIVSAAERTQVLARGVQPLAVRGAGELRRASGCGRAAPGPTARIPERESASASGRTSYGRARETVQAERGGGSAPGQVEGARHSTPRRRVASRGGHVRPPRRRAPRRAAARRSAGPRACSRRTRR